jgi:hypothetical protein
MIPLILIGFHHFFLVMAAHLKFFYHLRGMRDRLEERWKEGNWNWLWLHNWMQVVSLFCYVHYATVWY